MKLIPLTQGKTTIVDDQDYEWLSQYKWCLDGTGRYAARRRRKGEVGPTIILMQRMVMGFPPSGVDHIDGNTLNNKRSNLRLANKSENAFNTLAHRDNLTGVKGVSVNGGKFRARIWVNGKEISLGVFLKLEEAAEAYKQASLKYHNQYSVFNRS